MLATLLGSPAAAAREPTTLSLSYFMRCDEAPALLKPPGARLVDAQGRPAAGVTLTWSYRRWPVSNSQAYEFFGSTRTDADGHAELSPADRPSVPLDVGISWRVQSESNDVYSTDTDSAGQVLLDGNNRGPSTWFYSPSTRHTFGFSVDIVGNDVTQIGVGEGSRNCPRTIKAGATVELLYRQDGSAVSTSAGTTTTDLNGHWSLGFTPQEPGKYYLRARVGADRGAPEFETIESPYTIERGAFQVEETRRTGLRNEFTGAGRPMTLSYTLDLTSITRGKWRPTAQSRSASLWFRDGATGERAMVHEFPAARVVNGRAVFTRQVRVNRSGSYYLELAGTKYEMPYSSAATRVSVLPTLRGWPRDRAHSTWRKRTAKHRVVTVGSLQTSDQRVMLLERTRDRRDGFKIIRSYRPNSKGRVKVHIPRGWTGTRYYKVCAGVKVHDRCTGTTSGRWTITRK